MQVEVEEVDQNNNYELGFSVSNGLRTEIKTN